MVAVRKMLILLAIRMAVSDPKQSVHDFFQKMQKEVYKFQQSVALFSLPSFLPPSPPSLSLLLINILPLPLPGGGAHFLFRSKAL